MVVTKGYYPLNAFRVCADKIGEDVEGRIYSPLKTGSILFSGMGEMLVKMDELFDLVGYPQAFQDKRSFDKTKDQHNLYSGIPVGEQAAKEIWKQAGEHSTFDIMVCSRKNTSWQGSVYNIEGELLAEFDGEMALLDTMSNLTKIES